MLVRPRFAHLFAAGIAAPLLTVAFAGAAAAHGAPVDPVSRSAACGSDGRFTQMAACRAARAGDEGQWFRQWDNVRVANVNGRDREVVPDGHLCSAGISNFGGLDLARSDWPSTSVRAGKTITVSYRATIPHEGSFRMYVTKNSYNPKRALRWADLETKAFLTAKDPSFTGGAYTFKGRLPSGKVGRHVLYTVWQNSSTADTYYSCSDVVFSKSPSRARVAAKPTVAATSAKAVTSAKSAKDAVGKGKTARSKSSATKDVVPTSRPSATAITLGAAENLSNDVAGSPLVLATLAGAGLLVLAGAGGFVVVARRGRRRGGHRH